jgi:hypothetical protein
VPGFTVAGNSDVIAGCAQAKEAFNNDQLASSKPQMAAQRQEKRLITAALGGGEGKERWDGPMAHRPF